MSLKNSSIQHKNSSNERENNSNERENNSNEHKIVQMNIKPTQIKNSSN